MYATLVVSITPKQIDNMSHRSRIKLILNELHPSDAISLIESIGKELRRNNSVRISTRIGAKSLTLDERPDLELLKSKTHEK